MIRLIKELNGRILDIGGGGEGIIGRLYRDQVVAIDNRQEELDEAPDGFEKLLMDATNLKYEDTSFDHVTFFFTLMFMSTEDQQQAIREATRVLKDGGEIHIWDCNIVSAYPDPFCIDLEIVLPDEHISTTYGVGKLDTQNCASIAKLCTDAGLVLSYRKCEKNYFCLKFKKQGQAGASMSISEFWSAVLRQDADAIREHFHPDAWVNWHNTNEHFTVEEFIRANCEYPGEWDGEVERIITTDTHIITATHVYSKDGKISYHATSFICVVGGKIASIEEYRGDDGAAPQWRQDKHIGTKIKE